MLTFTDVATSLHDYTQNEFNIYPNPFNDNINISYTLCEATNFEINVYDMLGRKVILLDENNLSAGVHTIVLNFEKFTTSGAFILLNSSLQMRKFLRKLLR